MSKVIADMSMSLDGYVAGDADRIDEVFSWFMAGPETIELPGGFALQTTQRNADAFLEGASKVGAIVTGRRTCDLAGAWGGQHPVGCPAYVVSHRPAPEALDPETSTVNFVGGVEEAIERAKATAGDGLVGLAGGSIVSQALALGALDQIRVSLVPFVLGSGVPFFPELENAPVRLEGPEITEGDGVTHLLFSVAR